MTAPIIEDDYDAIPDGLKERSQWLLWDSSSDTPRRPHWKGDFGVSWTDPNDWHTFEEAVEAAHSTDSWGIGYVFSDLGPFTFLDLDGCLNSRGGPKDWVPSLEPFLEETYLEVSASGTGLHVILNDFEEPVWWSDTHFSDDEHEGVEVYEQKFCAFTGSPIEPSGLTVGDVDATDWLIEAYKSINGEDPTDRHGGAFDDASEGGRASREEFLEEDDIRDALDAIDPDVSYPVWRDIGFALKDFFASSHTALSVFTDWSRRGTKWDADAEEQAERIVKDATAGGGRTIGTVIYHAREAGWELPTPSGDNGPAASTDLDPEEVDRGKAILQSETAPDDPIGKLECDNGGYGIPWVRRDSDGQVTDSGVDPVCNFTLETLSFLSIEDQHHDEFVVRVHPSHPTEQPYDVRITPAVFNSSEMFRAEVVTGRTTWFDPTNREGVPTTTILRYLRETVGAQPAPHRTGQPYVGLSDDTQEFVTPAGSLTDDGWTTDPKYEYYSIGGDNSDSGPFAQKWALDPDAEVDVDEDVVARICELLPNTRETDRGLPILGWFYAAPIKTLIQEWEGEFPILAPHGDTGSGKTSVLETFLQAFGGTGEPLSSTDTKFTKEKHLAESRGFPVWIDEYKPTEMTPEYRDHLHQRLKEVTKERTMPKGRPDLGIDQLHMRAPVILSGEQKISDAAVRRRSILTNLSREPTRDGTPQRAAFGELTGISYEAPDGTQQYPDGYDLRHHARAYYEWVLSKSETELANKWRSAREQMKETLQALGVSLEASEQRGIQTIWFGVSMAREFAEAHGADTDELPTDDDVMAACEHIIQNIGKEGQRREHADELLEVLSLAATEDYLEPNVHHRVLESTSAETEVLAVHMPSAFSAVKRFVRDSNLEEEYTLLSKTDYTNSFSNKAAVPDSYVVATNKRTRKIENGGKAVHFDHEAIRQKLGADFNIDSFRPDEHGDDAPAALANRSLGHGQTITAEVAVVSDGEYSREAQGQLRGPNGTYIGFVIPGGNDIKLSHLEGRTRAFENVTLRTDEDGLREAVINDATSIETPNADENSDGMDEDDSPGADSPADGDERDSAAADGGELLNQDLDDAIERWTTAKQDGDGADRGAVVAAVADDLGIEEARVDSRVDTLETEGNRIHAPMEGVLKPL